MLVFVLNAGSSSLKYQLFNMLTEQVIAKGMCERIGVNGGAEAYMGYSVTGKNKLEINHGMPTHKEAIELMISTLEDKESADYRPGAVHRPASPSYNKE